MSKNILSEDNIHAPALEKISHFHEETLSEVIKTISENKIVVIGMKQNPVVKSHGGTDSVGFAHSINVCNKIVKGNLIEKIKSNLITVDE